MNNYKELFYRSQAKMADTIEKIDLLSAQLKAFMCDMEELIVNNETITIHINQNDFKDVEEENIKIIPKHLD